MNLFFVYDISYCKADEDDPKDAIIYFFPTQAIESERYLLCCQLVGVAKFLKVTFAVPTVIGLDQGKFAFHWSGKYLLVLGANSDVQSNVLQDQLSFLSGIFCFYHGSINNVLKACKDDREEFLAVIDLAWTRYISLSQCFGNTLHFSMNALPLTAFKKSTGLVSKANRLLQMCQMSSSVMAGAIYYNSRVLASQLTPQLTNYLSLMSNCNASSHVNNAFNKDLPPDVELKYVHLSPNVVAKILKYNHGVVGSRIRLKSNNKNPFKPSSLPSYHGHLSSGSEADVDSGNCSESVPSIDFKLRNAFILEKKSNLLSWTSNGAKKSKTSSCCCAEHWRLLKKKLLSGRNQSCLKFIYEASPVVDKGEVIETEDSGIHPRAESENRHLQKTRGENQCVNVLCKTHADLQALSFALDSKEKHSNISTTSDLEFSCVLCSDRILSANPFSLKHWNSEEDVTCSKLFSTSEYRGVKIFENSYTTLLEKRRYWSIVKRSKIQVLKCRANSESCNSRKTKHHFPSYFFHRKHAFDSLTSNSRKSFGHGHKSSNTTLKGPEKYADIESNSLQRHILYVQRYGGSVLLLLFNKGYDAEIISYLWNCGFSILRDIEYSAEKITLDNVFTDPSFYIMLYNSSQNVLKEYPSYPSSVLTEKRVRESVQTLQTDFQMDSNISMFNLLSAYHSICASHKDQYFSFYIQPEQNSRKVETLAYISKRAVRRLEKVFKVTP